LYILLSKKTLFPELTHWTSHTSRLAHELGKRFDDEGRAIRPSQLEGETLLLQGSDNRSSVVEEFLAPAGVAPASMQYIHLTEAIVEMVRAEWELQRSRAGCSCPMSKPERAGSFAWVSSGYEGTGELLFNGRSAFLRSFGGQGYFFRSDSGSCFSADTVIGDAPSRSPLLSLTETRTNFEKHEGFTARTCGGAREFTPSAQTFRVFKSHNNHTRKFPSLPRVANSPHRV
jgi:hypothetical protein